MGRKGLAVVAAALAARTSAQSVADVRALTQVTGNTYCVDFSPYSAGYAPGNEPPKDVVAAQIAAIAAAGNIKCLLTYGSLGGAAFVPELAAAHGMKVIQGVWLDPDAANQEQIDGGIALANANPDTISAVMCGSEIRLRTKNHVVAEQLVASCVQQMRAAGVKQPLTHQATWPEWCNEEFPGQLFPNCEQWTAMSSQVDFISQTTYAWWENRVGVRYPCIPDSTADPTAMDAARFHIDRQLKVKSTYPDKVVIMSEVGWPGPPETYVDTEGGAPCSVANKDIQMKVMGETLGYCRTYGESCILFSSINEPWKTEGTFSKYWGYCDAEAPFACTFPTVQATGKLPATGPSATPTASLSVGASPSNTPKNPSSGSSLAAMAPQFAHWTFVAALTVAVLYGTFALQDAFW